ncbi:MAG TPA: alpha-L-rhamnosidase, partial [Terriglobia bacterium]|nr:alpha-L-rhamnosidase [Terriglobia bacterium]
MQPKKRFRLPLLLLLIAGLACSLRLSYSQAGPSAPFDLRCEYLTNPVGIDVRQPRFSWVLQDSDRGELQSAYQILVATSPQRLARDEGDQWDSGKVTSDNSIQVVYAGKPLASDHVYY